jgi:hypothetical protein
VVVGLRLGEWTRVYLPLVVNQQIDVEKDSGRDVGSLPVIDRGAIMKM